MCTQLTTEQGSCWRGSAWQDQFPSHCSWRLVCPGCLAMERTQLYFLSNRLYLLPSLKATPTPSSMVLSSWRVLSETSSPYITQQSGLLHFKKKRQAQSSRLLDTRAENPLIILKAETMGLKRTGLYGWPRGTLVLDPRTSWGACTHVLKVYFPCTRREYDSFPAQGENPALVFGDGRCC